ncbi:MAG: MltA domain-containing protein [Pseudomonadota bacterium]
MFVFLAGLVIGMSGCAPKPEPPVTAETSLRKLAASRYPGFQDTGDREDFKRAIRQSLLYLSRVPGNRSFRFDGDTVNTLHVQRSLETLLAFLETGPSNSDLDRFVRDRYDVYEAVGAGENHEVMFTGYYEPTVYGSLTPDDEYRYPLLSQPRDLLTLDLSRFSDKFAGEATIMARVNEKNEVVPYYSRKEINAHTSFQADPLVWLNDRTDRFFLEIQGSGQVILKQGGSMRVHYHTKNGHPYRSIGRYLIDAGEIPKEEMSMQAIRRWLDNNPERAEEVFNTNPSYVFFKIEQGGPYGSLGVEITPMRSIATDRTLFPRACLCFIETQVPVRQDLKEPDSWEHFSGFVMNQDTGGAIRGAGRADLFYGNDAYAEFGAGHMNHAGNMYFLILKQ